LPELLLRRCARLCKRTHAGARGCSGGLHPLASGDVEVDGIVADFSAATGAEAVIAKLPAVDVLVNNVGIFEPKPFAEIPDADWYRFFEINVMSGVRLARHYLSGMLKKNWAGFCSFRASRRADSAEMVHYG